MAMRIILPSILAVAMVGSAGCIVQSSCSNDADCSGMQSCCEAEAVCLPLGTCCDSADCPAGQGCVLLDGDDRGSCSPKCNQDSECDAAQICDQPAGTTMGTCSPPECQISADCPNVRFVCINRRCEPQTALVCAADMVPVEDEFCIDRYEASRPDATATNAGSESTTATSRVGVRPWMVLNNELAAGACEAAGKSLCSEEEWHQACVGPQGSNYSYGDDYSPDTCNGIDKYCYCGSDCSDRDPCPFQGCYSECGASFGVDPTGTNLGCTNGYGVFDINGNLWEHVLGGNDMRVRGGAFNCLDSQALHRCDYVPGNWSPSARGFRCCSIGLAVESDGGSAAGDPGPGDFGPGDSGPGDAGGGD